MPSLYGFYMDLSRFFRQFSKYVLCYVFWTYHRFYGMTMGFNGHMTYQVTPIVWSLNTRLLIVLTTNNQLGAAICDDVIFSRLCRGGTRLRVFFRLVIELFCIHLLIHIYGFNECERIYQIDLALLHVEAASPALWWLLRWNNSTKGLQGSGFQSALDLTSDNSTLKVQLKDTYSIRITTHF